MGQRRRHAAGCGTRTRRSGPARDEAKWLGWLDAIDAGRALLPDARRTSPPASAATASRTRCCSAWAARACAPKCWRAPSDASPARPSCTSSTRPIPRRSPRVEGRVDLDRTLVIVASKSGSTLEPQRLPAVLLRPRRGRRGRGAKPARRFVAITDPGSKLQKVRPRRAGFRHIVLGEPTIGGRYSALSPFGLVPAAVMGVDVAAFLDETARMVDACRVGAGREQSRRGARRCCSATRGASPAATSSRSSPRPASRALGAWLEQLVAESTGKNGQAIVPVDLERAGAARSLRRRSRLRLSAARHRARRGAGRRRRRARSGRAAGRRASTSRVRSPSARSSSAGRSPRRSPAHVLRHQPVRPAGRRGEQDRDEGADQRLRARRQPAGGDAGA